MKSAYLSYPQIPALGCNKVFKTLRLRTSVVRTISILLALVGAQPAIPGLTLTGRNVNSSVSKPIAQGASGKDVRDLKRGLPIECELKPPDVHSYKVSANVGQYFRVVVMQNGIDLYVKLIGPDQKLIIEVDSPNKRNGPEPVSAIAHMTGSYRLEVLALPGETVTGRYEIKLEALREPTELDFKRVAAERTLAEAEQLHAQVTNESLHQAIAKYNEALPILRAVGDRYKEAETVAVMGRVYFLLGDMHQALDYSIQALPLRRLAGDRYGERAALNSLGTVYASLGEPEKSLSYYEEALVLSRDLNDRLGEAAALRDIGNTYVSLDRHKAADFLNRSLRLARETQVRNLESEVLKFLGDLASRYGEPQTALEYYRQALQLQRAIGDKWQEAKTLNFSAFVYSSLGENQNALKYLDRSLALLQVTGNRLEEAGVLATIGRIHATMGEPRSAVANLEKALALARALKNKPFETYALQIAAFAYRDLGELRKAIDYYSTACSLYDVDKNQIEKAGILAEIASIHASLGEPDKAINKIEQALRFGRDSDDRRGEACTLSRIGGIYSSMNKVAEATSALERALSMHRAGADKPNEALTLYRLAQVEQLRGRPETARANIEAAITIIEDIRNRISNQYVRTSFSASSRNYYQLYIEVLMELHRRAPQAGYDAIAFQVSERGRARSLLESLAESHAEIRKGADPALLDRERLTQQRLNAKAESLIRLLNEKHTPEQERELRNEVEDRLNDYREVEAQIRESSPRYAALKQPKAMSVKDIQEQVLDENTLLLEYSLADKRSYLFVLGRTTIKSYELPSREEIERDARQVYEVLVSKADALYPNALATLSRKLLGPIAGELSDKRLLVVSDGALQYVPFAALPDPRVHPKRFAKTNGVRNKYAPMIARHEIITLPSASVLALQRQELSQRAAAPKKLVVIADPVFNKDDGRIIGKTENSINRSGLRAEGAPQGTLLSEIERSANDLSITSFERLPLSRREAEVITKPLPKDQCLTVLDFAANHGLAISPELSKYQIVHFATHSLLNNEHPELSGVVLSLVDEKGRPQNGFLRLNEVYNLNLEADLVVLSACQTALGKEIKGDGLVGLTRGFMYAGARRVVASLWKVSDKATSELMSRFYNTMLQEGIRPSAALRTAQLSMLKDKQWAAAYYWAGFVLQGDWR